MNIELRYQETAVGSLVAGWAVTHLKETKTVRICKYQVDSCELDPVVSAGDFQVFLAPGMKVKKVHLGGNPDSSAEPIIESDQMFVVTDSGALRQTGGTPAKMNYVWWAVGGGMAFVVLLFGLPSSSKAGPGSVPSFSLPPLLPPGISGTGPWPKVVYPLTGTSAHKPVVITFFASWCAPCQEELPMVAKATAQLMSQGTQVQFIGIDGGDDVSPGWSFVSSSGIKFPVAFDPNETFASSLQLEGPPTTIFVYRTGKIAEIVRGPVTEVQLRQWVKTISSST